MNTEAGRKLFGFPVRVTATQPRDIVTLRSFRSDGSVLDEQHLFIAHHGASPAPTTRRDAERVPPESAQSGGGMGNAYARGGGR